MKTEEQQVTIARLLGWSQIENTHTIVLGGHWVGFEPNPSDILKKKDIPFYPNDHDAINNAILKICTTDWQKGAFALVLSQVVQPYDFDYDNNKKPIIHIPEKDTYLGYIERPAEDCFNDYMATAAQKCEALLRLVKLWVEE